MQNKLFLTLILGVLFSTVSFSSAFSGTSGGSENFSLYYSNDVKGELEPCG